MKRAVALRYHDQEHDAPVVVSAGEGELAERIERAARELGVPVVRDLPLAAALSDLGVGESIPEALYEAVAAILGELALCAPAQPDGQEARGGHAPSHVGEVAS